MKKQSHISNPTIISEWFGSTPKNIQRTYLVNKPDAYRVLDIGAYVLENGICEGELIILIENHIRMKDFNEK